MDRQYFDMLYRKHYINMFRYANKILKNPNKAADIVQAIFVKLFSRETVLKSLTEKQIGVYLATCIRNSCISAGKSEKELLSKDGDILQILDYRTSQQSAEDELFLLHSQSQNQLYDQVELAMGELQGRYKDVITLRYILDLSYFNIGEAMNISEAHARQLAYLARQKLRRLVLAKGGDNNAR